MKQSIINIKFLVNTRYDSPVLRGKDLSALNVIENAFLRISDGIITGFGPMSEYIDEGGPVIEACGRSILPAWCDSHTHLVFAKSREQEFVGKIKGMTYAEIAAAGGGILNSAKHISQMEENELFDISLERLKELILSGTGAFEIKSGYGLDLENELKMLRVIRRLKETVPVPVKATFLGAHAFPAEYKNDHEGYIKLVTDEMIPAISSESLADYIDVFCEDGFFSAPETERICLAGMKHGLKAKIHANQLHLSGGVQTGVKIGAISVDHLETMDEDAINSLATSSTIGTLLPTAAFFLRMQFQPARKIIDAGCAVALASDFNPGSSPSGNMNLVISMACIQMKMLPEEAINAATLNGAHAMEIGDIAGSITPGKNANLIITKPIPSIAYLPYAFGTNNIDKVMISGKFM